MVSPRILIVEDEPTIGELLREIAEAAGFTPRWVESGIAGVTIARSWRPELCLLDLMLPDADGFEVCREIRGIDASYTPGILMLTGMVTWQDRVRGFDVGTDRFITKPFQVPELIDELTCLLDETHDRRADGLRREISLPLGDKGAWRQQIDSLKLHLGRSSPLANQDIDDIGRDLTQLREQVKSWAEGHGPQQPWHLRCRLFHDRMESELASDVVNPPERKVDSLHELFGLGDSSAPLPLPASIGQKVEFPDHGSVVVLTRYYRAPRSADA